MEYRMPFANKLAIMHEFIDHMREEYGAEIKTSQVSVHERENRIVYFVPNAEGFDWRAYYDLDTFEEIGEEVRIGNDIVRS